MWKVSTSKVKMAPREFLSGNLSGYIYIYFIQGLFGNKLHGYVMIISLRLQNSSDLKVNQIEMKTITIKHKQNL